MNADSLLSSVLSMLLGGALSTAWTAVTLGNRLTRVETKIEGLEQAIRNIATGDK